MRRKQHVSISLDTRSAAEPIIGGADARAERRTARDICKNQRLRERFDLLVAA